MRRWRWIGLETEGDGYVTFARVVVTGNLGNLGEIAACGSSKRHPDDRDRSELGEALAIARALKSAGEKLERHVMGRVKHIDDIVAHKKYRLEHPLVEAQKVQIRVEQVNPKPEPGKRKVRIP